eukprot:3297592-Alexandrium_andersonii.AAC.1
MCDYAAPSRTIRSSRLDRGSAEPSGGRLFSPQQSPCTNPGQRLAAAPSFGALQRTHRRAQPQ